MSISKWRFLFKGDFGAAKVILVKEMMGGIDILWAIVGVLLLIECSLSLLDRFNSHRKKGDAG